MNRGQSQMIWPQIVFLNTNMEFFVRMNIVYYSNRQKTETRRSFVDKKFNLWSFYLILVCIGLALYALYSNINHNWLVVPPNYILLIISLLALTFGIFGLKDRRNRITKIRSWLTIILSSLTFIGSIIYTLFLFNGDK